jgi:hypothetical protein
MCCGNAVCGHHNTLLLHHSMCATHHMWLHSHKHSCTAVQLQAKLLALTQAADGL